MPKKEYIVRLKARIEKEKAENKELAKKIDKLEEEAKKKKSEKLSVRAANLTQEYSRTAAFITNAERWLFNNE